MVAQTKLTASEVVEMCVTRLLDADTFYAFIILRHKLVEDPSCDTMWIDGRSLGYNPEFVLTHQRAEIVGTLAHEAQHIGDLHHLREPKGADHDLWNDACDHIVNGIVVDDARHVLPKGALPGIRGTTPEALYTEMREKKEQQQQQAGQQGPKDSGTAGNNTPAPGAGTPGTKPTPSTGDGTPSQAPQQQGDSAGEGTPKRAGEVRQMRNEDGTEMSPTERASAEAEAQVMITQAMQAATRAGNMPAGLAAHVKDVLESVTDWQQVLARWADELSRNDWSWTTPNTRHLYRGVILPSLRTPEYGTVVLGLDSSGSMRRYLPQVVAEVKQCLATYAQQGRMPELWALWCDTQVHAQLLEDVDDVPEPKGLGGTKYSPVFAHIDEEDLQPRGVVYLTDGECSDFGQVPPYPVLWIVTTNLPFDPPFGEVARMPTRLA